MDVVMRAEDGFDALLVSPADSILPPIVREKLSEAALYKKYKVVSRRGLKIKAKEQYAKQVYDHFSKTGCFDSQNTDALLKKGWLFGSELKGFIADVKKMNKKPVPPLAKAFKRFNYSALKFQKR